MQSIHLLFEVVDCIFLRKVGIKLTDKELEELVKAVSLEYFNKPFKHEAYFNHRLRTTGGRYHLQSHHLDFNPKIVKVFGLEIFVNIIKHELCHYHLHLEGRGYQHRDTDFKELLAKVGGLRYTPSIELEEGVLTRWKYRCEACEKIYHRKRRFNVQRFVCSHCRGKLKLKGQEKIRL